MKKSKKTKICAKCNRRKSINKFNKQTLSADGHSAYCQKCSREYAATYNKSHKVDHHTWYMDHRVEILAKYHTNKTCGDRRRRVVK